MPEPSAATLPPRTATSPFATAGPEPVRVVGPLTAATAPVLRRAADDIEGDLLIDLSAVSTIDACGIGALLRAIRTVRERGGHCHLRVAAQHAPALAEHGIARLARLRAVPAGELDGTGH